jgi:hypothetical protein
VAPEEAADGLDLFLHGARAYFHDDVEVGSTSHRSTPGEIKINGSSSGEMITEKDSEDVQL